MTDPQPDPLSPAPAQEDEALCRRLERAPDIVHARIVMPGDRVPECVVSRADRDATITRIRHLAAENSRLRGEIDAALMLAEGPSTLKDLAALAFERGCAVVAAEARASALEAALVEARDALALAAPYILSQARAEGMLEGFRPKQIRQSDLDLETMQVALRAATQAGEEGK